MEIYSAKKERTFARAHNSVHSSENISRILKNAASQRRGLVVFPCKLTEVRRSICKPRVTGRDDPRWRWFFDFAKSLVRLNDELLLHPSDLMSRTRAYSIATCIYVRRDENASSLETSNSTLAVHKSGR